MALVIFLFLYHVYGKPKDPISTSPISEIKELKLTDLVDCA